MSEPRMPWIAEDPASKAVVELARKVAETSTTLLITGESGTGKDHLARLIHELGPRRDAPFLKIDCASLPQELVESELFGHERGAFTGAVERKLGRLEMAGAGTIVLDEVAALSPATQSKLLRVLEERQFERLGSTETITIEARLVALTNSDLARLVADGQFREDLFFRLSVLTISVPARRAAGARGTRARPRRRGVRRTLAPDACFLRLARQRARAQERDRTRSRFLNGLNTHSGRFPGVGACRGCRRGSIATLARRDRTPGHSRHTRRHALQNQQERRNSGH